MDNTPIPAYVLAEARRRLALSTNKLAEELCLRANPHWDRRQWGRAHFTVRRNWFSAAEAVQRDAQRVLDEEAAREAKYTACDAYRAQIAGTVPAHRLDTRQNGFLDGWDAALAWAAEQASK